MTRYLQVAAVKPGWKARSVLSLAVLAMGLFSTRAYETVQAPLEGALALKQVEAPATDYIVGQVLARNDVPGLIFALTCVLIAVLWIPFALKLARFYSSSEFLVRDTKT